MVFLLVFHNDPERPPHAFLLQRVSDRVLVTNLQVSHRSPPPSYSDGRERRMLSRRLTSPCPASACTPAWGPPGQSFYGLRLPHRAMAAYNVVSADSHVNEPRNLWTERMPAKLKDRAPQIVRKEDGDWFQCEGLRPVPVALG